MASRLRSEDWKGDVTLKNELRVYVQRNFGFNEVSITDVCVEHLKDILLPLAPLRDHVYGPHRRGAKGC